MNKYRLYCNKLLWNVREKGIVEPVRRAFREVSREIVAGGQHLFFSPCAELPEAEFSLSDSVTIERYPTREAIPRAYIDMLAMHVRKKHMREEVVAYYLERLLGLFNDGASLSIAIEDDRIGAHLWSLRSSGNYTKYFPFFPIANEDAVVFAGFVHPGFRGQNLMPALIRFNVEGLRREGMRQVFASCKVWNESSSRCIVKGGLRWFGTARPLKIFGRRIVIWARKLEE